MILAVTVLSVTLALAGQHGMDSEHGTADADRAQIKENELRQSVHRRLDCSDCHGESEMGYTSLDAVTTCASCHGQAFNDFRESVHARSVENGTPQAASCVACHGSHEVRAVADPQSPLSRRSLSETNCARCHKEPTWTETHPVPLDVVRDYQRSFHGLAARLGDERVANCSNCHSYHRILRSTDARSTVNSRNLVTTCGACHTGASSVTFAAGGVHHDPTRTGFWIVDIVSAMYVMMILLTIGFMTSHNMIDLYGRFRQRIILRQGRQLVNSAKQTDTARGLVHPHLRFTLNERIQHWILALSFITLALTGFSLVFGWQFPLLESQQWALSRSWLHRAASVVFISLSVYHVGYMLFTHRGRMNLKSLWPRIHSARDVLCRCAACFRLGPPSLADWRDLIRMVKYNLGFAKAPPPMGRFNYTEKLEYAGLVWGSAVMIVTGLILWFATPFLNRFPYWSIDMAAAVHYFEAILAVLSIVIWHFYFTIFNPDVFPLSKIMITGEIEYEEMERNHGLELRSNGQGMQEKAGSEI